MRYCDMPNRKPFNISYIFFCSSNQTQTRKFKVLEKPSRYVAQVGGKALKGRGHMLLKLDAIES